jgi:hypothetical protein
MPSSRKDIRPSMLATDSYASIAGALGGADEGIKARNQNGFTTGIADIVADPMRLETRFVSVHALVDFRSSVASDLVCREDYQGLRFC